MSSHSHFGTSASPWQDNTLGEKIYIYSFIEKLGLYIVLIKDSFQKVHFRDQKPFDHISSSSTGCCSLLPATSTSLARKFPRVFPLPLAAGNLPPQKQPIRRSLPGAKHYLCHQRCGMCMAPPKTAFNDRLLSTIEKFIVPHKETELSELGKPNFHFDARK